MSEVREVMWSFRRRAVAIIGLLMVDILVMIEYEEVGNTRTMGSFMAKIG